MPIPQQDVWSRSWKVPMRKAAEGNMCRHRSLMMATAILPEYRLRQAMRYCVSTIRATIFFQRHIRKKAAASGTVSLSLMTLTAT